MDRIGSWGKVPRGATVWAAAVAALVLVAVTAAGAAPPKTMIGSWVLLRDEGGMTPAADAAVMLTFTPDGRAWLHALRGATEVVDKGTYAYAGGKLTLTLPDTGKSVAAAKVDQDGLLLTLPFRVFDEAAGKSVWRRMDAVSLAPFASGIAATAAPAAAGAGAGAGAAGDTSVPPGLAKRLAKMKKAAGDGGAGSGGDAPPPVAGAAAGGGSAAGVLGSLSSSASGGAGADLVALPPAPAPPPAATAGSGPFAHLAGRWTGRAAGAETRFRKDSSITLYAKHVCAFWLDVDPMGVISGMGEIAYSIDVDRAGSGADSRVVADFVDSWQKGGTAAGAKMVRFLSGLPSEAVKRTFSIKGYVDPARNEFVLAAIGDLGMLDYTYTVGTETKVKPTPAWSPFFSDAGAKVGVSGSTYMARFDKSGVERKKPWQEYWYVWSATLSR
ncbi:MAG TPA: hypothetical protein VG389_21105 [Myxococcota bacterium]|nr:hypothetical protein [Myxococcota bacterium]